MDPLILQFSASSFRIPLPVSSAPCFWNTLNLCPLLNVVDHLAYPWQSYSFLCFNLLVAVDRKPENKRFWTER
jgi:hypothetical protein